MVLIKIKESPSNIQKQPVFQNSTGCFYMGKFALQSSELC